MKKTLKNILIPILATLLLFSTVFLLYTPNSSVFADNNGKYKEDLSDGNFGWTAGGRISPTHFANGEYVLGFSINIENPKHDNLLEYTDSLFHSTGWGNTVMKNDTFKYTFTLMQDNGQNVEGTPLARLHVLFGYVLHDGAPALFRMVVQEELAHYNGTFIFDPQGNYDDYDATLSDAQITLFKNKLKTNGKVELISAGIFTENGGLLSGSNYSSQKTTLFVKVNSPFQTYFCRFEYEYSLFNFKNIFGVYSGTTEKGVVDSESRAIASIIKTAYDVYGEDNLESFWGIDYYDDCINLSNEIYNAKPRTITVKYLEDIPGTPFATMKYETLNVPALSAGVTMDDVKTAMREKHQDFDHFEALDSVAYNIELDGDEPNVYRVHYYKNVCLNAMTVDGHSSQIFLDVNKSYYDFYYPSVENLTFSEDVFEYVYSSKILGLYPQLQGLMTYEVYGYFGFVAIPNVITFESFMSELFCDSETSFDGLVNGHYFKDNVNLATYTKMMTEFGYTITEQFWSTYFQTFFDRNSLIFNLDYIETNFYIIYAMPGTGSVAIGEGGQLTIDDGSPIKDAFVSFTKEVGDGVAEVGKDISSNTSSIIYGIMIAGGLYLLLKFGPGLGLSFAGAGVSATRKTARNVKRNKARAKKQRASKPKKSKK